LHDNAELSPVAVLVTAGPHDLDRARVDQFEKASLSPVAERRFGRTLGLAYLWRVDVREPDLQASIPDGVAIDDAVLACRPPTNFKPLRRGNSGNVKGIRPRVNELPLTTTGVVERIAGLGPKRRSVSAGG